MAINTTTEIAMFIIKNHILLNYKTLSYKYCNGSTTAIIADKTLRAKCLKKLHRYGFLFFFLVNVPCAQNIAALLTECDVLLSKYLLTLF